MWSGCSCCLQVTATRFPPCSPLPLPGCCAWCSARPKPLVLLNSGSSLDPLHKNPAARPWGIREVNRTDLARLHRDLWCVPKGKHRAFCPRCWGILVVAETRSSVLVIARACSSPCLIARSCFPLHSSSHLHLGGAERCRQQRLVTPLEIACCVSFNVRLPWISGVLFVALCEEPNGITR